MKCPLWPLCFLCRLTHRRNRLWVLGLLGIGLSMLMDHWVYQQFIGYRSMRHDWQNVLRDCGYLPVWLVVGVVMLLIHRNPDTGHIRRHRGTVLPAGLILISNVAACSIVAELLKLLVRRERPSLHEGMYHFRPWAEKTFNSGGLGMPSSHTMVAISAAWILSRLYPRGTVFFIAMGLGCGYVRVSSNNHFFSDAVVSVVMSYFITQWIWGKCQRAGQTQLSTSTAKVLADSIPEKKTSPDIVHAN